MAKNTICLWYDHDAEEAARLDRVAPWLAGRLARPAPPLVLDADVGERRVLGDDQVEDGAQVRL